MTPKNPSHTCAKCKRPHSPGDGVTRYRFFTNPKNDYFGPENGIHTALGLKAAWLFVHVNRDRQPREVA